MTPYEHEAMSQKARDLVSDLRDAQALNTEHALDPVYPWMIRMVDLIDDLVRALEPEAGFR